MKLNLLFLFSILIISLGFSAITATISNPAPYYSPELNFNTTLNVSSSAGTYITQVNFSILDFSGNVLSSFVYTNVNTSLLGYNQVLPVSVSSGNYRLRLNATNNATTTAQTIIEIYPRATLSNDIWICEVPSSCNPETYIHSSGSKFYISDNNTCPNLGLGQLNSNYYESFDPPNQQITTSTAIMNFNPISSQQNNKRFERILNNTGHICLTGTISSGSRNGYEFSFTYNLSGTLTHNISFKGVNYTSATAGTGIWIKFLVNGTNVFNVSALPGNNKTLPDSWCLLNSTGLYCNNATASYNYSYNFGANDYLTFRYGMTMASDSLCPKLFMNFTITNVFLENYTGFGSISLIAPKITGLNTTQYMLGDKYNSTAYFSICPLLRLPPFTSINAGGNFTFSNSNVSAPQPTVQLMLYYNSQLVKPYIYYAEQVLGKSLPESTMGTLNSNVFIPASGSTKAYNQSIVYIYSKEMNTWFLIPPFNLDPSVPYVISLILDLGNGTGFSTTTTIPKLPLEEHCNDYNNTYYINAIYPADMTYQVSYLVNNVSYNTISYGTTFNYTQAINGLTNVSQIQYYANAVKKCEWNQNGTIAISGIDLSSSGEPLVAMFFDATLLFLAGMSAVFPGMIIITAVYNDIFKIIPNGQMGLLLIMIAFIAYVSNWWGSRNLKTMVGLIVFGLAFLMWFNTGEYGIALPTDNSDYANTLETLNTQWNTIALIGGSSGSVNWNEVLVSAIALPITLINLIIQTIFMIPAQLQYMLMQINPGLASIFSFFYMPLILYGIIWLCIKGYEIISKQNLQI